MELNMLHFSHPEWFFGLIILPLAWFFLKPTHASHKLEAFIDRHLLPFLLVGKEKEKNSRWKSLVIWSLVWTCMILALAGPRFSFREVDVLTPGQNLVIALDLSESMNADDVKPSRLKLAKLKIEDLINSKEGVKLGLIAFAKDPHMIAPLTDDKETIRSYLPSISTDLVHVQGSRLTETLAMAANMLDAEPGSHKAILLISDGGFEDASSLSIVNELNSKGIKIHVVGMGTPEGALLINAKGNVLK
jgi:Ca-activated chloride channel family protein